MRLSYRFAPAILVAALLPAASVAQLKPVVATFTVPVTITNMDDEALHKFIGDLRVQCDVLGTTGTAPLARGSTKVDLVVTPATSTARATANFSGNVVVPTYAAAGGSVGGNPGAGSAETADQAAARNAIQKAARYRCDLMGPASSGGTGQSPLAGGALTSAMLTRKDGGTTFAPTPPVTTSVNGNLSSKP